MFRRHAEDFAGRFAGDDFSADLSDGDVTGDKFEIDWRNDSAGDIRVGANRARFERDADNDQRAMRNSIERFRLRRTRAAPPDNCPGIIWDFDRGLNNTCCTPRITP